MHEDDTAVAAGAQADPHVAVQAEDIAHMEIAAVVARGRGEVLRPSTPVLRLGKTLCHAGSAHYIAIAPAGGIHGVVEHPGNIAGAVHAREMVLVPLLMAVTRLNLYCIALAGDFLEYATGKYRQDTNILYPYPA